MPDTNQHTPGANVSATYPNHMRVCTDCPNLIPTGPRCPTCARTRDKARGTNTQRGYDSHHRALRRTYQERANNGETLTCWRCGNPITGPFHLGHDDNDRTIHRGPEHPYCNLAAAGRATRRRE